MARTLSVIVPALNEAGNIEAAVATVLAAIGTQFDDFEILVFDDGSTDDTGVLADRLAAADRHIKVIHNPRNMGFGYNYTRGVELAGMEHVVMFPGDNEIPLAAMQSILGAIGQAEIVIPYISTPGVRAKSRQVTSSAFVWLVNMLFGLSIKYFNGPCVHRRALLQSVPMRTHGFAYMASILVRLIRSGHTYVEVPMPLQARQHGRSKAFRLKNIVSVVRTLAELFWEVQVKDRHKYAHSARSVQSQPSRI